MDQQYIQGDSVHRLEIEENLMDLAVKGRSKQKQKPKVKPEFPCALPNCNKVCTSKTNHKAHIEYHHGGDYLCDLCQTSHTSYERQKSHFRNKHSKITIPRKVTKGAKSHDCEDCKVHYSCEWDLHFHVALGHAGCVPCSECGDVFEKHSQVLNHKKDRHQASKRTCKLCKETFTFNIDLERHVKEYHTPKIDEGEAAATEAVPVEAVPVKIVAIEAIPVKAVAVEIAAVEAVTIEFVLLKEERQFYR